MLAAELLPAGQTACSMSKSDRKQTLVNQVTLKVRPCHPQDRPWVGHGPFVKGLKWWGSTITQLLAKQKLF